MLYTRKQTSKRQQQHTENNKTLKAFRALGVRAHLTAQRIHNSTNKRSPPCKRANDKCQENNEKKNTKRTYKI